MTYAYLPGPAQPETTIRNPAGRAVAGAAVGIVVLDLCYPLLPGNVANASTYGFPVLFHVLKGTSIPMIMSADPALLDHVIEGGRELQKQGARAVVGACGYFANYQKEAAAALDVPVYLSSLLQVPLILQSLKPDQKVGVICADLPALKPTTLAACGIIDTSRLELAGAQDFHEFRAILDCRGEFDSSRIERDLVGLAEGLVRAHPEIGALLLECSDMPPYAWAIQNAVKRPVYDFISLINWIHFGAVRRPFTGFI